MKKNKQNDILVSIIIPTYKRPDYLKLAIDSCIEQTHKNIEIIIVNDSPEISVRKIVEKYNDQRLILLEGQSSQGAPSSRNLGLSHARGEYINFLDDDDILYSEKIEKQLNKFSSSKVENLGVVVCDILNKRDGREKILKNRAKDEMYHKLLNSYCIYSTHTMLIKKSVLDTNKIRFDNKLASSQEYDLQIQLSKHCNFDYISEVLCEWCVSREQISKNLRKKILGIYILFRKYKTDFKKLGWGAYIRNYYFRQTYLYIKNITTLI